MNKDRKSEIPEALNSLSIEDEVWKPIKGFDGYYVSSKGRFYRDSIDMLCRKGNQIFWKTLTPKLISMVNHSSHKYSYVPMKNGKHIAHRIVAREFIPNPENKRCVNHKNCIRTDNRAENLEWVTHKENSEHAKVNNRFFIGENNRSSKLKEADVAAIMDKISNGEKLSDVAKSFNISSSTITHIKKGYIWTHVTNIPYVDKRAPK